MTVNTIATITPNNSNTSQLVEANVQIGSESYNIFFRSKQQVLDRFLYNLEVIQNVYSTWNSKFQHVELEGFNPIRRKSNSNKRVGAFFSGGVDSFHTLIEKQYTTTDLIFIHGADLKINNPTYHQRISDSIQNVATHFNINLIEIETNFRELIDPYIHYGKWGWPILLAIAGNLLHPYLSQIYIPENFLYSTIAAIDSVLKPLWQTESFEYATVGLDTSRFEKVTLLSKFEIALENLRVYHKMPDGALNCGRRELIARI